MQPVALDSLPPPSPSTRFVRWVRACARAHGCTWLARSARVSRSTIHRWLDGENKYSISPYAGQRILQLSWQQPFEEGRLGWNDLYGPIPRHPARPGRRAA